MAFAFINSTGGRVAGSASTGSIVPLSSIEGGASFVLGISIPSTTVTVTGVTDNAGNTYQLARRSTGDVRDRGAELWYASNISSASTRISYSLSGASSGWRALAHFRGMSTGSPLDQVNSSHSTTASTGISAKTITPSTINELVVMYAYCAPAQAGSSAGPNFTLITGNDARGFMQYWIQGAAVATDGPGGISSAVTWASVIASFYDTFVSGAVTYRPYSFGLTTMGVQ